MRAVLFFCLASFCVSCAHVNSLSITQIPIKRDQKVEVTVSKIVILGLNFSNDYVDEMTDDLKSQCPNGKVTGVLTKDVEVNYFLWIVYKKQVEVTGYCEPALVAKKG